jgi:hypothetical protein
LKDGVDTAAYYNSKIRLLDVNETHYFMIKDIEKKGYTITDRNPSLFLHIFKDVELDYKRLDDGKYKIFSKDGTVIDVVDAKSVFKNLRRIVIHQY